MRNSQANFPHLGDPMVVIPIEVLMAVRAIDKPIFSNPPDKMSRLDYSQVRLGTRGGMHWACITDAKALIAVEWMPTSNCEFLPESGIGIPIRDIRKWLPTEYTATKHWPSQIQVLVESTRYTLAANHEERTGSPFTVALSGLLAQGRFPPYRHILEFANNPPIKPNPELPTHLSYQPHRLRRLQDYFDWVGCRNDCTGISLVHPPLTATKPMVIHIGPKEIGDLRLKYQCLLMPVDSPIPKQCDLQQPSDPDRDRLIAVCEEAVGVGLPNDLRQKLLAAVAAAKGKQG
jgi:hypothetical protein